MNKYLKYFSGTLVGLMLSTSAFAAAEYAVVLKTLSNPFWVDMNKRLAQQRRILRYQRHDIFHCSVRFNKNTSCID